MKKHNRSFKALSVFLSVLILCSVIAPVASAAGVDSSLLPSGFRVTKESTYHVVGGVTERHFTINNKSNSNQINSYTLEVDLNDPAISIVAGYNDGDFDGWGRATVLDQADAIEAKRGVHVIGGLNADFFNKETGEPIGLLVMDGIVGHGSSYEPFFGITKDGKAVIRPAYSSYDDIVEGVGGNAILVKDGKVVLDDTGYLAPRTAIGIKADGTLVFFAADGRMEPESCGMNNGQIAHTMLALGCVDALSLDGGGSATMIARREADNVLATRNKPCYGFDRPVSTSLMICSSAEPTGVFDHVAFSSDRYLCNPDSSVSLSVRGVDENGFSATLPFGGKLQVADKSYGYVVGSVFHANGKSGTVDVNYILNDEVVGKTTIEIDKSHNDMFTEMLRKMLQKIMNLFQLIEFTIEKIKTTDGIPLI